MENVKCHGDDKAASQALATTDDDENDDDDEEDGEDKAVLCRFMETESLHSLAAAETIDPTDPTVGLLMKATEAGEVDASVGRAQN